MGHMVILGRKPGMMEDVISPNKVLACWSGLANCQQSMVMGRQFQAGKKKNKKHMFVQGQGQDVGLSGCQAEIFVSLPVSLPRFS